MKACGSFRFRNCRRVHTKNWRVKHTITHHRLDVSVYEGKIIDESCQWKNADTLPMSSLTRKIWRVAHPA
jgi:hypothetical protein